MKLPLTFICFLCFLTLAFGQMPTIARVRSLYGPSPSPPVSPPTWAPPPVAPPTRHPTVTPTRTPTKTPSAEPTWTPTKTPSAEPTWTPTKTPSNEPTRTPTKAPTAEPTWVPTESPTATPTLAPSASPTVGPSFAPSTVAPSAGPTVAPTFAPTAQPSATPTTSAPTHEPTPQPSVAPTPNIISGLLLEYDFEYPYYLTDSANGLVLTKHGSVSYPAGEVGSTAAKVTSGYFTLPDPGLFLIRDAVTLSAWVKFDVPLSDQSGAIPTVFMRRESCALRFQRLNNVDVHSKFVQGQLLLDLWNDNGISSNSITWPVGEWFHVAGTYDRFVGKMRIYFNGVLNVEGSFSGTIGGGTGMVLSDYDFGRDDSTTQRTTGTRLEGSIDDVRVYDRQLTSDQLAYLYEYQGFSTPGPTGDDDATEIDPMMAILISILTVGVVIALILLWFCLSGKASRFSCDGDDDDTPKAKRKGPSDDYVYASQVELVTDDTIVCKPGASVDYMYDNDGYADKEAPPPLFHGGRAPAGRVMMTNY